MVKLDSSQIWFIVVLIVLLGLSASFSASETAFSSLNSIRMKQMAKAGNPKAKSAYKVSKNFTETITTILIGNNLVNIFGTALATSLFSAMYGAAGVAIATAMMTLLILVFGEILPKIVAKTKAEDVALFYARPLYILSLLFKPITSLIVRLQESWEKRLDIERVTATEDELLEIVSAIEQEGILEQEERELIESVIEFDDTSVREVMVPLDKVVFLYDDATYDDLRALLKQHKLSRIPIISSDTLEVIGVLRVRDVLDTMLEEKTVSVLDLMQKPIYVPQRRKLPQVLEDIQKSREHMGIVVESMKSNRFVGIVTLEDILEELVGEIYDEYDSLPKNVVEIGHHTFHIDGHVSLHDFFDNFVEDQDAPYTKARTIASWVSELNEGRKVRKNRVIEYQNFVITVLETEQGEAKRIELEIGSFVNEEDEL
ncbi:MAG: hemolysin family protein [Erysipelotrichaceae bacterium]